MRFQRLRKVLRWTLRAILALAVLLIFFILEENIRGHIILARYKAELHAKGEKLSIGEFNFPKPVQSDAFDILSASANELTNLSQAFVNGALGFGLRPRFIGPGCCVVRELQEDTDLRLPNTGAARSYSREYYYVYTWEELAEKVAVARQPLRTASTILQKPVLASAVDYHSSQIGALQSRVGHAIGEWSSVAALSDLHGKDLDAALEDLLNSTELIGSVRGSQSYGLHILMLFTGEGALNRTWEATQTTGWNDTQLARLQEAWEKATVINDFEPSMAVQRAVVLDEWDKVLHKPRELLGWSEMDTLSGNDISRRLEGAVWYAGWREQDQARGLWLWAEGVDATRAALSASTWIVARDAFAKALRDEYNLRWPSFDRWRYQMSIPEWYTWRPENLQYEVKRLLEYETRREMTVAAIALKRFELRHNKLAPDLTALVPEFLAKVPHDYMDGRNLRYRLKGDSDWVLYSVGEDCVDDGGDARPSDRHSTLFSFWDGRDAVWPAAATREEVEAWELKRSQRTQPSGGSKR